MAGGGGEREAPGEFVSGGMQKQYHFGINEMRNEMIPEKGMKAPGSEKVRGLRRRAQKAREEGRLELIAQLNLTFLKLNSSPASAAERGPPRSLRRNPRARPFRIHAENGSRMGLIEH